MFSIALGLCFLLKVLPGCRHFAPNEIDFKTLPRTINFFEVLIFIFKNALIFSVDLKTDQESHHEKF